ncbi:MAG: hypothetical protein ACRD2U_16605 [Terriglobales bacterium]
MWLLIGWIVTMIAFVVAVDYTCAQINEISQRVDSLKMELRSFEQSVERCAAIDMEMLSKKVDALNKTMAGGLAALLAKGSTSDDDGFPALFEAAGRVDLAKLLWEAQQNQQTSDE